MRYKTTPERAFYRSLNALEGLRKDLMREDKVKRPAARAKKTKRRSQKGSWKNGRRSRAKRLWRRRRSGFAGRNRRRSRRRFRLLEQWVEIEVSPAGKTVTTQYPSNEILIQDGQKKWPAPEMVYRRMHFVHGVPHEYAWATSDERIRKSGGMGIQRMTVETWLELIEKEKALGTGHLLPCGGNLPRPEERGGCDCPTCSKNQGDFGERGRRRAGRGQDFAMRCHRGIEQGWVYGRRVSPELAVPYRSRNSPVVRLVPSRAKNGQFECPGCTQRPFGSNPKM